MLRYRFIKDPDEKTLARVAALYAEQGWWTRKDRLVMLRRMVRQSHCFLIAEEGGQVAGMGRALNAWSGEAYIHDVAVLKAFRGRKVGSQLMKRLVSRLKKDGVRWIGLIASGNSAPFYEGLGFSSPAGSKAMTLGDPNV
jgi:ribosomal protein S18 acetylase RimI-like enzyme